MDNLAATIVYPNGVTNGQTDYSTVNITYKSADLKLVGIDKGQGRNEIASWIGIEINTATSTSGTPTAKLNGEDFEADEDGYHIFTKITPDVIKEALNGDGNIKRTYVIEWSVEDDEGEIEATLTQTINLIIKAENVTVTNSAGVKGGDNLVWTKEMAKAYKATLPAATETEGNKTTEENKKDDVPKTGEEIPMALVFVVGNVSAKEGTAGVDPVPEIDGFKWTKNTLEAVTSVSDKASYSVAYDSTLKGYNFDGVTITYSGASLTATNEGDAAKLTTKIAVPTPTLKDNEKSDKTQVVTSASYKYSVENINDQALTGTISLDFEIKSADLYAAAKSGQKTLNKTFTINVDLYDDSSKKVEGATKAFTINVVVDITDLTFTENKVVVWNKPLFTSNYVESPATETEENKTTEENKKDDVPKTGKVIPMT